MEYVTFSVGVMSEGLTTSVAKALFAVHSPPPPPEVVLKFGRVTRKRVAVLRMYFPCYICLRNVSYCYHNLRFS
jgi:hypothetical protein